MDTGEPGYRTVNVAAEERDTSSVLQYFRRMVQLPTPEASTDVS